MYSFISIDLSMTLEAIDINRQYNREKQRCQETSRGVLKLGGFVKVRSGRLLG
jgi:hypothetical protein